jgi:hypothetical protein
MPGLFQLFQFHHPPGSPVGVVMGQPGRFLNLDNGLEFIRVLVQIIQDFLSSVLGDDETIQDLRIVTLYVCPSPVSDNVPDGRLTTRELNTKSVITGLLSTVQPSLIDAAHFQNLFVCQTFPAGHYASNL